MKDQMFDRILDQVGDPCFIVWYFSTGEPLLHKGLADLVSRSRHHEIFSIISTNLSLKLSDDSLTALLTCGLGIISASIDGATQETYSQYRRGGAFQLVADNVQRMVALERKLGLTFPLIEWRFLRFRHNEHEEDLARKRADEWGVDLLEFWPGAAPPEGSPGCDGVFASVTPLRVRLCQAQHGKSWPRLKCKNAS
jgi:MoaA/NifB/PqqE/SkfB family radical SAM enzyme